MSSALIQWTDTGSPPNWSLPVRIANSRVRDLEHPDWDKVPPENLSKNFNTHYLNVTGFAELVLIYKGAHQQLSPWLRFTFSPFRSLTQGLNLQDHVNLGPIRISAAWKRRDLHSLDTVLYDKHLSKIWDAVGSPTGSGNWLARLLLPRRVPTTILKYDQNEYDWWINLNPPPGEIE